MPVIYGLYELSYLDRGNIRNTYSVLKYSVLVSTCGARRVADSPASVTWEQLEVTNVWMESHTKPDEPIPHSPSHQARPHGGGYVRQSTRVSPSKPALNEHASVSRLCVAGSPQASTRQQE